MRHAFFVIIAVCLAVPALVHAASTCTAPLAYSIASIDSRFGISQGDLVDVLAKAEAVWEQPAGRDLFTPAPSGGITVRLVYDARQAKTDEQKATAAKLAAITSVFDALSARFQEVASSTRAEQDTLASDADAYETAQDLYNADVRASNASGGASPAAYAVLSDRAAQLKTTYVSLTSRQDQLADRIRRINALGTSISQLITVFNAFVRSYNASLADRGAYEEGYYQYDGVSRSIAIFEFQDTTRLTRALAHELGHALGLEHVASSGAIMYPSNESSSLHATAADLAELDRVCK